MKVLPFSIPKTTKAAIIVQEDRQEIFYDRLHQHPEVQLSYILQGQGSIFCKDSVHPYQAGELILIPGGVPHVFNSRSDKGQMHHRISVFFEAPWLKETIERTPELSGLKALFQHLDRGYHWQDRSGRWAELTGDLLHTRGTKRFMTFLAMMPLLKRERGDWLITPDQIIPYDLRDSKRMTAVIDYTMNRFMRPIRLEELAAEMAMTRSSFCKYFKKRTGKTYFGFLLEVRTEHACRMLLDRPDESIATIAEDSGFANIANFNRRFKIITGLTPRDYRKRGLNQRSSN